MYEFEPYEKIDDTVDYGCVFFRKIHNDLNVTNWKPLSDLSDTSFNSLKAYLTILYGGDDPQLEIAGLRETFLTCLEDKHRYQYLGVENIPDTMYR